MLKIRKKLAKRMNKTQRAKREQRIFERASNKSYNVDRTIQIPMPNRPLTIEDLTLRLSK